MFFLSFFSLFFFTKSYFNICEKNYGDVKMAAIFLNKEHSFQRKEKKNIKHSITTLSLYKIWNYFIFFSMNLARLLFILYLIQSVVYIQYKWRNKIINLQLFSPLVQLLYFNCTIEIGTLCIVSK